MPANLHIFISNRLEILAGALAELTRSATAQHPPDPLQPEIILVQSKGMQRWISMALAAQNRICANTVFPFPNAFLEEIYTAVIGELPASNFFDTQNLTFRIMSLLNAMIDQKAFWPIRNYLSGQGIDLKAYQLSKKIADVFDQYLVFRPETILAWERGQVSELPEEHAWQALLWQRIVNEAKSPHRVGLQGKLIQRLADIQMPIADLPPRISVFGISYLPSFHLQVIEALAHRIPVYLFLLNPCRQYWTDIYSEHQLIRLRTGVTAAVANPADLHIEHGNRLLSSWGQQGRQFFGLIHHLEGQLNEMFEDCSAKTLLGRIQQDILDLVDRSAGLETASQHQVSSDGSIRVQVCHSPMREVEVLHDQLLDLFDSDSQLHPADILVMTPDIGRYAPFVHAVFGTAEAGGQNAIPYSLADQSLSGESRLVEGYLRLLQLKESRFEISRVVELLEYEDLRRRFDLEEGDLHLIETWLRQTNIRWGWDAEHRQRQGLPKFETNTWRTGLDRLIAGYAMLTDADELFAGVLPHEGIEGRDVQTLGSLIRYAETLYRHVSQIPVKTTLEKWAAILFELIDTFFHADEHASRDMQALRSVIGQLDEIADDTRSQDEISFDVVHQFLTDNLKQAASGAGFMAGSVTFCAMLPMRSIPAKVICLLGLQHDAFPQEQHEPGFSLIASAPRPGDRSKRNDDKYLFLEALLSARNVFYISYIGRDIQDNAPKPPSVLVSELLEYIAQGYGITAKQLITEHPLQPFSPAYFDNHDPRLFSYSKENREALGRMTSQAGNSPFFSEPLPPPEHSWYQCELKQLFAFFANPTRFLLEQRLGIYLRETLDVLEDRERFNLDPLSGFQLSQQLLASVGEGRSSTDHFRAAVAAGDLPMGIAGKVAHDRIHADVMRFLNTVQGYWPEDEPKHIDLDLDLPPFHLTGSIHGVCTRARVAYRMARLRPRDLLSTFITHLALTLMGGDQQFSRTSFLVCKDAVWEFGPMAPTDATEILKAYLALFWEGLQNPLVFFDLTSFEFAYNLLVKQKNRVDAFKAAINKWQGGYNQAGESQDAYISLCFRDERLFTPEFENTALKVFRPMFSSAKELRIAG